MYLLYLLLGVLHLLRGRFVEGAVCLLKMLTGNNLDVKYGFCAVRVTWRSFQILFMTLAGYRTICGGIRGGFDASVPRRVGGISVIV